MNTKLGKPINKVDIYKLLNNCTYVGDVAHKIYEVTAPLFAEFDRIFAAGYPAEFQKATIGV